MLFIRINKINWLQLYENSVMVKNQRTSSFGYDLAPLGLRPPSSHYFWQPSPKPAGARRQALGEGCGSGVGGGERGLFSWQVIISRGAFCSEKVGGKAVCRVLMHEISFQADKRFAEGSLCRLLFCCCFSWLRPILYNNIYHGDLFHLLASPFRTK